MFASAFLWIALTANAQYSTSLPQSKDAVENPEVRPFGSSKLFVKVDNEGLALQVHILQRKDAARVGYDEIEVRAFDESHAKIAVAQSLPEESHYMGSSQSTGFYRLSPTKDQRMASVSIARGDAKQTFTITPTTKFAPSIQLPTLQGQPIYAYIYYEGANVGIAIHFFREEGDPGISYSAVHLRAFDATGAEVPVSQADPREKVFGGPSKDRGKYLVGPKGEQRVVSVEVARGGERRMFSVTH